MPEPAPVEGRAPGRVRRTSYVLRRTLRGFLDDDGTDLAAALTFYSVLALFPGAIALLALVGVLGQEQSSVRAVVDVLRPLVGTGTLGTVESLLAELARADGAGLTLLAGVLGALWSASGYVGAFSRMMNRVYDVQEGRPFWRMRPMQLLVTVLTLLLCAVVLVILVVSGPVAQSLGDRLGLGDGLVVLWGIAKWPVLAVAVMVVVALLYWATPNVRMPSFRVVSPGAFVAIVVWLVASAGFALYVATFGSYNRTYGSVAGAVVALLWLWITNVALVFGAELDAELERVRQLREGVAAEERVQLPVRDQRGIDKAARRREEDLERQRELRTAAAGPTGP